MSLGWDINSIYLSCHFEIGVKLIGYALLCSQKLPAPVNKNHTAVATTSNLLTTPFFFLRGLRMQHCVSRFGPFPRNHRFEYALQGVRRATSPPSPILFEPNGYLVMSRDPAQIDQVVLVITTSDMLVLSSNQGNHAWDQRILPGGKCLYFLQCCTLLGS